MPVIYPIFQSLNSTRVACRLIVASLRFFFPHPSPYIHSEVRPVLVSCSTQIWTCTRFNPITIGPWGLAPTVQLTPPPPRLGWVASSFALIHLGDPEL